MIMRVLGAGIGLGFILAFCLMQIPTTVCGAAGGPRFAGTVGVGYHQPTSADIGDRYGGAPSFEAGVEFDHPKGLFALEAGLRRCTASLNGPFYIDDAKGTLTAIPIDLLARWPLSRTSLRSPYGGLGFELLWIREGFEYKLDGEHRTRNADGGVHPGLVLVAGVDRNRFPRVRLEGSFSYVPMHRLRSSAGTTYDESESPLVNAGGFDIRLCWRLP